jgi:hypothetical protein
VRDDPETGGAEEGHVVGGEDVGRRGSGGGRRLWWAAVRRGGTFASLGGGGACGEEGCNAGLERVADMFLFEGASRGRAAKWSKNLAKGCAVVVVIGSWREASGGRRLGGHGGWTSIEEPARA